MQLTIWMMMMNIKKIHRAIMEIWRKKFIPNSCLINTDIFIVQYEQ